MKRCRCQRVLTAVISASGVITKIAASLYSVAVNGKMSLQTPYSEHEKSVMPPTDVIILTLRRNFPHWVMSQQLMLSVFEHCRKNDISKMFVCFSRRVSQPNVCLFPSPMHCVYLLEPVRAERKKTATPLDCILFPV